jgi:hypothetical protein
MNKNRTNLLLIGALVVLLVVTAGFILGQDAESIKNPVTRKNYQKSMKNLEVKNDLQKYGIEVVSSTDFNFNAELAKYIGGNEDLTSLVNSAKPFAFFIKNNSSKEIVAISLRWKFIDSKGKNFEIPQTEANPGVLMGIKPLDPKMVGKTSLINSKEVKFFTYFNDFIGHKIAFANMRLKNPTVNYPYAGFENSSSDTSNLDAQKERILNEYADFSLSIDGIVFNDGTFVGDDQNLFFETLRGDIQARKDILTALAEANSKGKSHTNILDDILSNTSNISVNPAELRTGNATREQVFDFSYKTYLKNLGRELVMKRTRMSDDYIVSQLQSVKVSDFVTLRKLED